ncbi:MAG: LptF/LptG family permease [Bacteroidales bacterium]
MIAKISKYTIKSFIPPFLATFSVTMFVLIMMFLWNAIDKIAGKGLDTSIILKLLGLSSINLVPMALPIAILLASLMCFGNLGERYELIAIKSSGISFFKTSRGLAFFTVILSAFSYYFTDQIQPRAYIEFISMYRGIRDQKPDMIVDQGIFSNNIDKYSIKVGKKNENSNMMYDLLIYDHSAGHKNTSVTVADSGIIALSEDKSMVTFTFFSGNNYAEEQSKNSKRNGRPFRRNSFDKQIIRVPVSDFGFDEGDDNKQKYIKNGSTSNELKTAYDSIDINVYMPNVRNMVSSLGYPRNIHIDVSNKLQAIDSLKLKHKETTNDSLQHPIKSWNDIKNNFDSISMKGALDGAITIADNNTRTIESKRQYLNDIRVMNIRIEMERQKKYALPFTVILFFFIGAPLGSIIRKGGFGWPVVISILIYLLYFVFTTILDRVARAGSASAFWAVWWGPVALLIFAFFLSYQANNDSAILSKEAYTKFINKHFPQLADFKIRNIFRKASK